MLKKFLIKMIRLYQIYISPMKRTKCPYIPHVLNMVWKQSKNMVRLREGYLQYGEYYAVILFLMEDMIPYHKFKWSRSCPMGRYTS